MEDKKWMRCIDPGSPLCGWDLLCKPQMWKPDGSVISYEVVSARRLDVLIGDRPIQFNPPNGLGLYIKADRIEESPLQGDEIVEIAVDAEGLYGEHLERRSLTNQSPDGTLSLDIEVFENATMLVLTSDDGVLAKNTLFGPQDGYFLDNLERKMDEMDVDALIALVNGGGDGRAKA